MINVCNTPSVAASANNAAIASSEFSSEKSFFIDHTSIGIIVGAVPALIVTESSEQWFDGAANWIYCGPYSPGEVAQ